MTTDCQAVESYCLARSWRLRCREGDARRLIRLAVAELPDRQPVRFKDRPDAWASRLRDKLAPQIRQTYGNPVVIWILLNIVLPVVIKLVIEWWFNRHATETR